MHPEKPSTTDPPACSAEDDRGTGEADDRGAARPVADELEPLPRAMRILLLGLGIVFLLLGIAGLALPFLQGILFIAIGLALLSLTSQRVDAAILRAMERWPRARMRIVRFRRRMHSKLHRGDSKSSTSSVDAAS